MEDEFRYLEKATIALNHLTACGATHSNSFAAITEFVDNSSDANATQFHIDIKSRLVEREDGKHHDVKTLEFMDNGDGMSRAEALKIICFGHSEKCNSQIGRYGVGLKCGAFHFGRELLLLTKQNGVNTMLLLSHAFHEKNKIKDAIFAPSPSFDENFLPFFDYKEAPSENKRRLDLEKHEMEMAVIKEFAPYGNLSVQELFDKIPTDSGTLVIVERLTRSLSAELAFDVLIQNDIQAYDKDAPAHEWSLRSYLEALYLNPRMKIWLRGEAVVPKRPWESWLARYQVKLPITTFKDVLRRSADERNSHILLLEGKQLAVQLENDETLKKGFATMEEWNSKSKELRNNLEAVKKELEKAKKEHEIYLKSSKTSNVTFFMGVETVDRNNNGIHFYVNGRLVTWAHKEKAANFFNSKESIGISGFVNLDSSVWRPLASKEGLKGEDMTVLCRKFNIELKEFFEFFKSYWIPKNLGVTGGDVVAQFWTQLGYQNGLVAGCERAEVTDTRVLELIKKECPPWHSCDFCRLWKLDVVSVYSNARLCGVCRKFDDSRGRLEAPQATDGEHFKMEKANWIAIKRGIQKEKERAAKNLARPVALAPPSSMPSTSTPSASIPSTSTPSASIPSTSMPPNSILKKAFTGGSGHSQSNPLQDVKTDPMSPPQSTKKRPSESAAPRSDRSRVMIQSDSPVEVIQIDYDNDVIVDDDVMEVDPEETMNDDEEDLPRQAPNPPNRRQPTASEDDEDEEEEVVQAPKPALARRSMTNRSQRQRSPSDDDEEEEEEVVQSPKPALARRSIANSNRGQARQSEDEEEEEEEESDEDQAPPPKKPKKQKKFNREEKLEKALNDLLAYLHLPPLPRNGVYPQDLSGLVDRSKAALDDEADRMRRQLVAAERNVETVLQHLGSQPYSGIDIGDHQLPVMDRFHDVANQIREKKNKKKKQQKKK